MTGLDLDRIETAAKKGIWSVVLSSTVLALVARIREAEAHADAMVERASGFEMRARRAEEDAQELRERAETAESELAALTAPKPIPYRGALGLRTMPDDIEAQIRAQLATVTTPKEGS